MTFPCEMPLAFLTPNVLSKAEVFECSNSNPNTKQKCHSRGGCGIFTWLGLSDLFQTFEDLESVVDKEAEIANIRELLDESDSPQNDAKEPLC